MKAIEKLQQGEKKLYHSNFFSGDYKQDMIIMKSKDDGSHKDKYYLELYSYVNGIYTMQAYIYFYLELRERTCYFIGMKTEEQFRNCNMGSLLISAWLDFCLNNGIEYIGVNNRQRKPFILYMLKTYAFDVEDLTEYSKRSDVISICRNVDNSDKTKYLLFRDDNHEKNFKQTNIYKSDNYIALDYLDGHYVLDDVIFPLQDITRHPADYFLTDKEYAGFRSQRVLHRHMI